LALEMGFCFVFIQMMKQNGLDDVDRRLLRALQDDASLSHAALAEKAGSSPASCWRRIKALEEAGVLKAAVRLVDAERVGRGVNVMCQVRMKSHAPDDRRAFEDYLTTRPDVMEAHSMSGEWDYLLRVVAADVAGYEQFLMRDLLNHPNVATAASHFALSQVKYTTALPI
jgi:Lrp/AsnC family transcriptional regulator